MKRAVLKRPQIQVRPQELQGGDHYGPIMPDYNPLSPKPRFLSCFPGASGNLTLLWKITILGRYISTSPINGSFSIAISYIYIYIYVKWRFPAISSSHPIPGVEVTSHHIVGSWEKWSIHKSAMAGDDGLRRQATLG